MTTTTVSIEIDPERLGGYSDQHLALLWRVAQANPAPYGDQTAAELVKGLGWEIIRRWLKGAPEEMYHHQADAPAAAVRGRVARYRPGGADDRDGTFHDGVWTLNPDALDAAIAGPPPGTTCPYCAATENLLRIEHGPGAGQVWVCRDSQACRTRRWKAAEADDSLVCARCNRIPGVAAAPAELVQTDRPVDLGGDNAAHGPLPAGVWVCVDRARCDARTARGARPTRQYDRDMQIRVAELGAANAIRQGLGPAECENCGHDVPADLKSPHKPKPGQGLPEVVGSWRCRGTEACEARARDREADRVGTATPTQAPPAEGEGGGAEAREV